MQMSANLLLCWEREGGGQRQNKQSRCVNPPRTHDFKTGCRCGRSSGRLTRPPRRNSGLLHVCTRGSQHRRKKFGSSVAQKSVVTKNETRRRQWTGHRQVKQQRRRGTLWSTARQQPPDLPVTSLTPPTPVPRTTGRHFSRRDRSTTSVMDHRRVDSHHPQGPQGWARVHSLPHSRSVHRVTADGRGRERQTG